MNGLLCVTEAAGEGHGLRYHPCDSNITFFFRTKKNVVALDPLFCFSRRGRERLMFLILGRWEKGVVEGVRALNLYSSCFFSLIPSQTLFSYDGVG